MFDGVVIRGMVLRVLAGVVEVAFIVFFLRLFVLFTVSEFLDCRRAVSRYLRNYRAGRAPTDDGEV